jgi:hypothetical protein
VARLGRTLKAWRQQLLAYFDTSGVSNGGKEANNIDEVQAGRYAQLDEIITEYHDPADGHFQQNVMSRLDHLSGREFARLVGADRRTIDRIRSGHMPRPKLRQTLTSPDSPRDSLGRCERWRWLHCVIVSLTPGGGIRRSSTFRRPLYLGGQRHALACAYLSSQRFIYHLNVLSII